MSFYVDVYMYAQCVEYVYGIYMQVCGYMENEGRHVFLYHSWAYLLEIKFPTALEVHHVD